MASATFTSASVTEQTLENSITIPLSTVDTAEGTIYSVLAKIQLKTYTPSDTTIRNVHCDLHYGDTDVKQATMYCVFEQGTAGVLRTYYCAFSGMTAAMVNSITSIEVYGGFSMLLIEGVQTVEASDVPITKTGAPTVFETDNPYPVYGENVLLTWSGATPGTNNPIIGYHVYRSTDGGETYDQVPVLVPYTLNTFDDLEADAPAVWPYTDYYKVHTIGVQDGYESDDSIIVIVDRVTATRCEAPTWVWVNNALPGPEDTITLYWQGALGGENNPIGGYRIAYFELVNNIRTTAPTYATIETSETSGHLSGIPIPETDGASYYFFVTTLSSRDAANLDSGESMKVKVTLSTLEVTNCGAPEAVTIDSPESAPGDTVTVSWSGATPGTNNAIDGYDVYRAVDDESEFTFLTHITTTNDGYALSGLQTPVEPGRRYYFKIVTVGIRYGYNSVLSQAVSVRTLTLYCLTPTKLSLSTYITEKHLTISWSGAAPGIGNAITGYEIQSTDSENGSDWSEWVTHRLIVTGDESGTLNVTANDNAGAYRKYRIQTMGAAGSGYYSEWSTETEAVRTVSSKTEDTIPLLTMYEYPHVVDNIEKGPYPLGIISHYNTMILHRKYLGVGELSLSLPFSEEYNGKLDCWNLIGIAGSNEQYLIVRKVVKKDEQGVMNIEITAVSLVYLLGLRVITYSALMEARPVTINQAMLRNQPVLMDYYDSDSGEYLPDINGDLSDDSYGDRRFPDLHWKEQAFDAKVSDLLTYQPELQANLLDAFIDLCKIEGCGVRVTGEYYTDSADSLSLWLQLYKGVDRSISQDAMPHIVFDEQLGNILTQTYTHSIENLKTAGYAKCSMVDSLLNHDNWLIDITSDHGYTDGDQPAENIYGGSAGANGGSGVKRAEIGIVVSDIDEPELGNDAQKAAIIIEACKRAGKNDIAQSGEEHTMEIAVNPDAGPKYGVDFYLGDIVTARSSRFAVSMNARITEDYITYEAGKKPKIELTLGETATTLLKMVKQIARRRG